MVTLDNILTNPSASEVAHLGVGFALVENWDFVDQSILPAFKAGLENCGNTVALYRIAPLLITTLKSSEPAIVDYGATLAREFISVASQAQHLGETTGELAKKAMDIIDCLYDAIRPHYSLFATHSKQGDYAEFRAYVALIDFANSPLPQKLKDLHMSASAVPFGDKLKTKLYEQRDRLNHIARTEPDLKELAEQYLTRVEHWNSDTKRCGRHSPPG